MSYSGFLILDKPLGATSRGVVDRTSRWFPRGTRLGHTGTLDPLATGVLVVAVGQGTRLTEEVQRQPKTYRAGIRLGACSDTDDAEGKITNTEGARPVEREVIDRILREFTGVIEQVPPAFSAAKIGGRRAYALARRGADVELTPRQVRIDELHILSYVYPDLDMEVRCGKGTYIRSLARDLGKRLGCGAYLQSLRRTSVGSFHVGEAITVDADSETARRALKDLSWALSDWPRVTVTSAEARRLACGQVLAWSGAELAGDVAIFDDQGRFVGAGHIDEQRQLQPCKVFWRPDRPETPASDEKPADL